MPTLPDYNPKDFEIALGKEDIANNRFRSVPNSNKKPYTIVMPPPNVTGMLHMGHILNNTIQDVLIRYKRMNNFEACWIPGLDHASISTETKVTEWLDFQNIKKEEIGREKFLEYAVQWKNQYGGIINNQLKRLGVSCDWSRERFTMDKEYSQEVLRAFVDLYNDGLVYKGYRLVNWCPKSQSAISDDEVEHKEEQGYLWFLKYPIKDSQETVTIATTRPETYFGDTAVMVNPNDNRYKHLIGKTVILPLLNREIPVIADDYVDPEFGTGVVKVTPAHDPNDYEVGKRHNLPMITVMNNDATMNDLVPMEFQNLDRYIARKKVITKFEEIGLLEKIQPHTLNIGYSQRGGVPIEPMLSEQWFISMKELAEPAKKAVEEGEIKFHPDHWTKTYYYWLDNIKDWCISRQLWWGHQIPVFSCDKCGETLASVDLVAKCPKCESIMVQEESVLDTWASSWLWSYAVHKTDEDKNYYHPTDTLVTGPDIIFFWVARMIMAAKYFRKEIPFKNVYFTGIIRDDLGRKMSKTLGNSPDPMGIMAEYGADALRFMIIRLAPLGNDILYSSDKIELGRRFANKIWNAARFVQMNAENNNFDTMSLSDSLDLNKCDDFDKSILTRLNKSAQKIQDHFDKFRINDVTKEIYDFIWGEFCDFYVENSKFALTHEDSHIRLNKLQVILHIFKRVLKLLHPVMPFISEELYRKIFGKSQLMFERYPYYDEKECFEYIDKKMQRLEQALYLIREMRAESNIPPATQLKATLSTNTELKDFFIRNIPSVQKLVRISSCEVTDVGRSAELDEVVMTEYDFEVFLNLDGAVDKEKEMGRLTKELERLAKAERSVLGKLSNEQFVAKAPADVIEKEKAKLLEIQSEKNKIEESIKKWMSK